MLKIYVAFSTILFFFLAVIWDKKNVYNLLIKCVFVVLALLGLFNILVLDGYVVRIP